MFCLPALTSMTSRGGMFFSPAVTGLDSTEYDGVQTGVSRTFHDLGFPAQLLARHLRNHDCANAARPPQHSLSVAQF